MSTRQNWKDRGKRHEKQVAKDWSGVRHLGVTGEGREDVEHSYFSIECKSREKSTAHNWMEQAERNAPTDKVPVVIVKRINGRPDDNIVCIRQSQFFRILKTTETFQI
jgi:hypothetical protein